MVLPPVFFSFLPLRPLRLWREKGEPFTLRVVACRDRLFKDPAKLGHCLRAVDCVKIEVACH